MRWIEIVTLQSDGSIREKTIKLLKNHVSQLLRDESKVKVRLYRHAMLESDISVCLKWESDTVGVRGSKHGIILAEFLRDLGMVNHSVWIEESPEG